MKMGVYCVHMCFVRREEVFVWYVCRVLRGKRVAKCTYMGGIVGCTYMREWYVEGKCI